MSENRDSPYLNGDSHHLGFRKTWSVPVFVLALALSFAAFAQSGKVYRIGVLDIVPASANRANLDALLRGLREAGYDEGRNIVIDYRSADGRPDRFAALAADLARAKPDIILTRGTPATIAAKAASSSPIPIVMTSSGDPVGAHLIANFARPGGSVTGLTALNSELHSKRIGLMRELFPAVKRVGFFVNGDNPNTPNTRRDVERAAQSAGLEAHIFDARDAETLNRALQAAAAQRVDALLISGEGVLFGNRRAIIEFAAKRRLPVMYSAREFVEEGGLVSYGVHYPDLYYRAASYVDRIFKGAKAGDLPTEQPTKLELVINLKAAKALGVVVSRDLLLRTDEVIQ